MTWDVVVVGGGPAGLMAALAAAERGARVTVLEHMPAPARKLLASGGGQGNVTHGGEIADFLARYHGGDRTGEAGRFLRPALYSFSNRDLMAYLSRRGIAPVEDPDGRVFPASRRAGDVLAALLAEARRLRVEVRSGVRVPALRLDRRGFKVLADATSFFGRTVVLATGGRSYPSLGATGDGYALAQSLGHRIVPPRPALAPVAVKRARFGPFAGCAGVSLRGTLVTLVRDGKALAHRRGDVLFTHRGLSGPAVLDLSGDVAPGDVLRVALAPGLGDAEAVGRRLEEEVAAHGRRTVTNLVAALGVPRCLARAVAVATELPLETKGAELTREARWALAASLSGHAFPVASVGGWNEAMVTRGGVTLDEVDPKTMESRLVPGLFFAGEVLDVDGDSGGYNLQAAFSTGRLAGRSAAGRALGEAPSGRKMPPHQGPRPAREPDPNTRHRPQGQPRRSPRPKCGQDDDLRPRDEKRGMERAEDRDRGEVQAGRARPDLQRPVVVSPPDLGRGEAHRLPSRSVWARAPKPLAYPAPAARPGGEPEDKDPDGRDEDQDKHDYLSRGRAPLHTVRVRSGLASGKLYANRPWFRGLHGLSITLPHVPHWRLRQSRPSWSSGASRSDGEQRSEAMRVRQLLVVALAGGLMGVTALGCDFVFSYKSLTAPLGATGEVGIRVVKTHAGCTLPNPYAYDITARGVQILGETAWKDVQPNVIEKWVLLSLAEVGDGFLKISKTCSKEGYEEGVLPIKVTAPPSDGVWSRAWAGTYPFSLPEGYTVVSVVGTATVKDAILTVGGKTFTLPSVPPTLVGRALPVQLYYVIKDGKPFPVLLVGEGLFWRYDPLLVPQG